MKGFLYLLPFLLVGPHLYGQRIDTSGLSFSLHEKKFLVFEKEGFTKTKLLKVQKEVRITYQDSGKQSTYIGPLQYDDSTATFFIQSRTIPLSQVSSISYHPKVFRALGGLLLVTNVAVAMVPFYLQYHLISNFSDAPLLSSILIVASTLIWVVQIPYAFLSSGVYNIFKRLDMSKWALAKTLIKPGFKGIFKAIE